MYNYYNIDFFTNIYYLFDFMLINNIHQVFYYISNNITFTYYLILI